MSVAIKGQDTTISISTDAGTTYLPIAEVRTFSGIGGGSASVIDTTHLKSIAKEKKVGLADEGQLSLEMNYVPTDAGQIALKTSRASQSEIDIKIELSDGTTTGTTWEFKAYVLSFGKSGGVDDVVKASASLEISGAITETAAV